MDTETSASNATSLEQLGERVRTLRKARGWTLNDLAERTGLAISTISKIERAELSPTYDRFMSLARGLGVDIGTLLAPSAPAASTPASRADDVAVTRAGHAIRHDTEHYVYWMLCHEKRGRAMTPMLGEVKENSIEAFDRYVSHRGDEFVYVLEGELTLHFEGRKPTTLAKGDSAYFRSELSHAYVSSGAVPARFLVVCWDEDGAPDFTGFDNGPGKSPGKDNA